MSRKQSNDAVLNLDNGFYDVSFDEEGDIATDDFFDTAVIVSLGAEKRASAEEVPNSELRRGWIGNESTPNFEIGSKNWLYEQARQTRTTLNGLNTSSNNALDWMRESGVVVELNLNALFANKDGVGIQIDADRSGSRVSKFYPLWNNTGIR